MGVLALTLVGWIGIVHFFMPLPADLLAETKTWLSETGDENHHRVLHFCVAAPARLESVAGAIHSGQGAFLPLERTISFDDTMNEVSVCFNTTTDRISETA